MENKTSELKYYIGEVIETSSSEFSREYHIIKVNIPGVINGVQAFPKLGELDEPRVGDQVLLLCLDPIYFSYLIYSKLKESDFIGFRASGKMLDVTEDSLSVSVFNPEENTHDTERPEPTITEIRVQKDGDIAVDLNTERGKIIINNGTNGGIVNISALRSFLRAVVRSIQIDDHGASLIPLQDTLLGERLEDKRFKH